KQQQQTSKFCISAADRPLASEILEGPYTIAARLGDTESKLTVDVFKYVLPKFTIDVELDRPYYQPGQVVKGTVRAKYTFGSAVAHSTVEIDVGTIDIGPRHIEKLRVQTDDDGKAAFQFLLPTVLVGR